MEHAGSVAWLKKWLITVYTAWNLGIISVEYYSYSTMYSQPWPPADILITRRPADKLANMVS